MVLKRSDGCRKSIVHVVVDVLGCLLRLCGQFHDGKMIGCFLNLGKPLLAIVADKVYGSARIRR